jgi:hypothetical protein
MDDAGVPILLDYIRHLPSCRVWVIPSSDEGTPSWPVTQKLRDMHPDVYGKYACSCGLDELLLRMGITPV